jgi:hypothetical protein
MLQNVVALSSSRQPLATQFNVSLFDTRLSLLTHQLPVTAVSIELTFASLIPLAKYITFLIPSDVATLKTALSGSAKVGASSFFPSPNPVTAFSDRLVLHPTINSPVWILANCNLSGISSVICDLPKRATGSFWRFYIDWAYPLPDSTAALRPACLVTGSPMLSSDGLPLTVSFAFPYIIPQGVRRFSVNPNTGLRIVPSLWLGSCTGLTCLPNTQVFDSTASQGTLDPITDVFSLPAVPQIPEPLYIQAVLQNIAYDDFSKLYLAITYDIYCSSVSFMNEI